ncbi:MAG: DEAD/DEAH box helicase [Planctomycetaceae bacterium]
MIRTSVSAIQHPKRGSISFTPTPGSRVLCRDAQWHVKSVSPANVEHTEFAVHCVGVDPLVRNHETIFLTQLDEIQPVDPRKTELVPDSSRGYKLSKLFVEAQLRQMPATGLAPDLSDMGAFRPMPFQVQTVRKALEQLRPRLLLADAVGLGKTIQVGMVLSELMRRGRADRVLVLAKKSMLTQFQAELWNRFGFPLVRLDSASIARLRLKIPSGKNPFEVYNRVIVSIDTLKNVGSYRHFLENARWDCVVIDEAHNVAGASVPQRHLSYRLARLLARKSDAMLLTTATPHNGKRDTFGRLISLLDPSAIPDPDLKEYSAEDIANFFLMRFKEDVREDAGGELPNRMLVPINDTTVDANASERQVFATFAEMRAVALRAKSDPQWRGQRLLQYGLYKQFLSSPESCRDTIRRRLKKELSDASESTTPSTPPPRHFLKALESQLSGMSLADSSRFQLFLEQLHALGWNGKPESPRVLIFTEYRQTQDAIAEAVSKQFNLHWSDKHEEQAGGVLATIHGGMSDVNLMNCVEAFSTGSSPMRMLVATDVASEGINLHHQCHQIIHFDLPWSIITLVQRNGRIDRFGQTQSPVLRYLRVRSGEADLKGDETIFERLVEKVEEINRSTRQGETVLKLYDEEAEQRYIAENGILAGNLEILETSAGTADPEASALEELLAMIASGDLPTAKHTADTSAEPSTKAATSSPNKGSGVDHKRLRLMTDLAFLKEGYSLLAENRGDYAPLQQQGHLTLLSAPKDLARYLGQSSSQSGVIFGSTAIPSEAYTDDHLFRLTDDPARVEKSIKAARNTSGYWSRELLCTDQHPIMKWITEQLVMLLDRGTCPHITTHKLRKGEFGFCFIGSVSSQAGRPLVADAHAVCIQPGGKESDTSIEPLAPFLGRAGFGNLTNIEQATRDTAARLLLHTAVDVSLAHLKALAGSALERLRGPLQAEQRRLRTWSIRTREILDEKTQSLDPSVPSAQSRLKEYNDRRNEIDDFLLERTQNWLIPNFGSVSEPTASLVLVMEGVR